jgi:hypothetical protein
MIMRDVLKREENTTLEYFLLEEEARDKSIVNCNRRTTTLRNRQVPCLMEKLTCHRDHCQLRHEIDYWLALNRAE